MEQNREYYYHLQPSQDGLTARIASIGTSIPTSDPELNTPELWRVMSGLHQAAANPIDYSMPPSASKHNLNLFLF